MQLHVSSLQISQFPNRVLYNVNCSPFPFPRILHSYCIQMALRYHSNQWHTSTGPVYPEHRLSSPTNINLVVPEISSFQNFCDKFPNLERFVLMDITTEPETAGQYLHSNLPYLDKTSWPSGSHSCFVLLSPTFRFRPGGRLS